MLVSYQPSREPSLTNCMKGCGAPWTLWTLRWLQVATLTSFRWKIDSWALEERGREQATAETRTWEVSLLGEQLCVKVGAEKGTYLCVQCSRGIEVCGRTKANWLFGFRCIWPDNMRQPGIATVPTGSFFSPHLRPFTQIRMQINNTVGVGLYILLPFLSLMQNKHKWPQGGILL